MERMNQQQAEWDEQRLQANRQELVERISRCVPEDGNAQPLKGFDLHRLSAPRGPVHGVTHPSFCVSAQGSKEILLGDNSYHDDPMH